jgi:hypothetical protein
MARYGLEAQQLGDAIMQMQLDAKMQALAADWALLSQYTPAGSQSQMNLAMGMLPALQAIINDALTNGLAIDESLRPLIDLLIQMGLLTNLTGGVLDASQLTWQQSITDTDRLLAKLDEIIAAILYGVAGSAGYTNAGNGGYAGPGGTGQQGGGSYSGGPIQMASGSGGILNFGAGVDARLHGFEGVFTSQQMNDIISTASQFGANSRMGSLIAAQDSRIGGGSQPVNINIIAWDGASIDQWLWSGGAKKLATAVVPEIPDEAWRQGLG